MDTTLTKYEQSKLNHAKRLEEAKKEFEERLAKEMAEKIINNKKLKKRSKIKKAKNKAKEQASNILKAIDNGFQF
jgi:hypothetical protein